MENKDKILQTALKLFYENGYDVTGVQEIADISGITKPTLYHYFGSKQGLLEAILQQHDTALLSVSKLSLKYEHDLYWTLTKFAKAVFKFAWDNKEFYSMQLSMWFSSEKSVAHTAVKPYLGQLHKFVEDLFIAASFDHGNLKGHEKLYTITFIGMINTYITVLQNEKIDFDEQIIHKAIQQFMHGIFAL